MTVAVSAVLRFWNWVGAPLAVILCHIFTLFEGSSSILQNVANAESVTVESSLLAEFRAV